MALLVPNVPEFSIAYFGILYAGAVVVPINVLAAAPEVAYFLEDANAKLLIAHPLFEAPAREGAAARGACREAGGCGGGGTSSAGTARGTKARRARRALRAGSNSAIGPPEHQRSCHRSAREASLLRLST